MCIRDRFHILVEHPSSKLGGLPIHSLDDGIIEGALLSRYSDDSSVEITRTPIENAENSVKYDINFNS